MKRRRFPVAKLIPLFAVLAACSESPTETQIPAARPSYSVAPTLWSASGPGTVTLHSDGSAADPWMSYARYGSVVFSSQRWSFSTTAASTGSVTQVYDYSGYHAFFMVRAFLQPFVIHNAVKTYLPGIFLGPANCCSSPSGGFRISGSTTFAVTAGDTYGYEFGGQNYDSDSRLLGDFRLHFPDATPPVVQAVITGTLGNNGWYTSDVSVAWNVSDAESAIISPPCATTNVTTDTNGATASCSATSAGGTANASATVKRDATEPVVTYTGNAGSYLVDQTVAITCSASDAMSGIATDTCVGVNSPAYALALGNNTLSATATDQAGNGGSGSASFTVSVTAGSLCSLVKQWVTQAGVANSLCVKLNQSSANSFNNEIRAQTGKKVPADKAPILTALATALLGA